MAEVVKQYKCRIDTTSADVHSWTASVRHEESANNIFHVISEFHRVLDEQGYWVVLPPFNGGPFTTAIVVMRDAIEALHVEELPSSPAPRFGVAA